MNHIDTNRRPLIPALRFPQFTEQWENMKLGEVADVKTGSTPRTDIKEYYNGDKLFVSPADIQANKVIDITKTTLTDLGFSKGRKIPKGSVLFVCIGSTIGKVGIAAQDCLTNQQINALTAKKNYSNNFIYYLLENKGSEIKLLAGIQAVPQINKTDFCNLLFLFPSLPEQQKIADFLSAVDEKLQALKKKKHLWEQYKKGIMQQIFTQTLRFKDEQGNDFPEWEERKLGEVCTIKSGLSLDQNDKKEGYQVTRIETISDGKINLNKIGYVSTQEDISNYKLKKGDILFSNINSVSHIGKTALVHHELNLYHGMNLLRLVAATNTHSVFLFYYLNTEFNRNYFKQICNKAVSQASINQTELGKTPIPLPSLPEQQKIATFLSALDEKINKVQEQIAQVEAWKKGLLQQLFPQ